MTAGEAPGAGEARTAGEAPGAGEARTAGEAPGAGEAPRTGVRFHVLRPQPGEIDGRPLRVPNGKQRVLLTSLLLHANEVVLVEELIDRLWGEDDVVRPRRALHTQVTRLRAVLDRHRPGLSVILHRQGGGYLLQVGQGQLDLLTHRSRLDKAGEAALRGDHEGEARLLRSALSLWRGPVLADVPSESLHRDVAPRLAEERLRALERWIDVELSLGRHDDVIADLRAATREEPYRERLWWQLMLALHRSRRTVEALHCYRELRFRLREEMGVDPCADVRRLHARILRQDGPALVGADA